MTEVPAARVVFSEADRAAILERIDRSLQNGSLTLGPYTAELEEVFAARHGGGHAVATASGTSALEIIFRALRVADAAEGGAEVIVPANTFFATAAAVLHAGGRVRLADVDPLTMALSPATVEAALTEHTAGVVLVHIGGMVSPDTPAIADLCRRRGLWLVEDAAHAHGCALDGRSAGTFGVAAAFSFYPTKVITSAEGGMVLTHDEGLRDEARLHRDQGKAGFLGGEHVRLGAAWRMSEVHAAIGVVHLARLDEFMARREEVAARYHAGLAGLPGVTPRPLPRGVSSNHYKYVAFLDDDLDRDVLKKDLRAGHGVALSGEVYARPLHLEPVFSTLPHPDLAGAEAVCRRHVCLPLHSDMTDDEADHVVASVKAVVDDHD